MRDTLLLAGLAVFMGIAVRYPYAGVLTWAWLTLMNPNLLAYGVARTTPLNLIVAVITLAAWLASREKKQWPHDAMPNLMLALLIWMTANSFFAADPAWSWPLWERTLKIYVFVFLCMTMVRSKARIQALIWIMMISIGYFSIKGGVFTLATGGQYKVYGPTGAQIGDNNILALVVVTMLPLSVYLYRTTANRPLRVALALSIPLQIVTVLGSYSRGGVIALIAMLAFVGARGRHKLAFLVAGVVIAGSALAFMPQQFVDRMNSVGNAGSDESFQGRVTAWHVAADYAVDHFPLGAGFAGAQQAPVFHAYFPDAAVHAAHSIYFEVLGDHGFPGLILYLAICWTSLRNARFVARRCRERPELAWAADLATMLEVSLIGFYIGGAALSVAYYDGGILLQGLTSILRRMTGGAITAGDVDSQPRHDLL